MKLFTGICLFIGVALFVTDAWLLVHVPARTEPLHLRRVYAEELLICNLGMVGALIGAGVASVLIVRQAKRQYREEMTRVVGEMTESFAKKKDS